MSVAIDLGSGFVECLLLVFAVAAVKRRGVVYLPAALGMALLLYAHAADGFIAGNLRVVLTIVGLVAAGLCVVADLLFEVVPEPQVEARPPV